jgi:tetratricopeptide (TPR) repeat protein
MRNSAVWIVDVGIIALHEFDANFHKGLDFFEGIAIYFAIGDYLHSLQAYQEVIRIDPNDAMAQYNLG